MDPCTDPFAVTINIRFAHRLGLPKDSKVDRKEFGRTNAAGIGDLECRIAVVALALLALP
jgi:hypothetical protein